MRNSSLNPIPLSEAARLLAVSQRTVRRLVECGDIPAIRIGSTLAILPNAWPISQCLSEGTFDLQPLLSRHDVAQVLDCAPCDVGALAASGKLTTVMIGNSCRWRSVEVAALAQAEGVQ